MSLIIRSSGKGADSSLGVLDTPISKKEQLPFIPNKRQRNF